MFDFDVFAPTAKHCPSCLLEKDLGDFYDNHRTYDGKFTYCRECMLKKTKDAMQLKRSTHEGRKASNLYHRKMRYKYEYGITYDQYENMLDACGHVCEICGKAESYKVNPGQGGYENNKIRRLSLDHCHESGKVRGILCAACNKAIGSFCDNPETLEKAAAYLRSRS